MEKFNSAVQNLQLQFGPRAAPEIFLKNMPTAPTSSKNRGLLGIRVGRAVRHPRTNALRGHARGVPPRHPVARRVGTGMGIHLARCSRGHGLLAG